MNRMMKIIAGGFVLSAAITAHAGANLIKNGTFEGTATQNSSWGAYATAANISSGKFRCDNWTFYNSTDGGVTKTDSTAGLGKSGSTWAPNITTQQAGPFVLFIQSSSTSGSSVNAYVEQSLGVLTVGVYRVTFTYAVRASGYPVTTYIELVDQDGHVISVGSVKTTVQTAQSFSKDLVVPSGTYTFRLRQPGVSKDSSNIFEAFPLFASTTTSTERCAARCPATSSFSTRTARAMRRFQARTSCGAATCRRRPCPAR